MQKTSGVPKDSIVNTFWFGSFTEAPQGIFDRALSEISRFYNTIVTATGQSIAYFLSGAISRDPAALTYDGYDAHDLSNPILGPPFTTVHNGLDPTSAGNDPEVDEVACVLSYHSNLAGVPSGGKTGPRLRQRRRGRLYLGPLDHTRCIVYNAQNGPHFNNTFTETIAGSAARLMTQMGGEWLVHSRLDHNARQVTGGFVNNAPDTQRRRGVEESLRSVWGDQPTGP
jgi:hypothetical protein